MWKVCFACLFSAGAVLGQALNLTGSLNAHDPVMIKEGNTYYVFHTGNGIGVKTSSNMLAWTGAGSVLPSSFPAWFSQHVPAKTDRSIWAPDISFRDGKYWLYYSVSTFGEKTSAIGLATRTSLASGSWQDQGVVLASPSPAGNFNAIDPNIITDAEGKVWMNWGSWWDGIYIARINPETGKLLNSPLGSSHVTNIARRGGGIEGSFIIRARGHYYLFASYGECCKGASSTYNMRYGRSTSINGPYVDKAGTSMVSGGGTQLSDGSGQPGGHNGVFEENGNFYLVYHAYTPGNTLRIRRFFFDAENWITLDPDQASVSIEKNADTPGTSRGEVRLNPLRPGEIRFFRPGVEAPYDPAGRKMPVNRRVDG
jgi:arabinan endo-1,5-alpha-L-arabinosidase